MTSDSAWTVPSIDRVDPAYVAPERAALEDWLRFHRETLLMKCAGLTGEQLCKRAVPPSTLSLLGLVRHMSEVERSWFQHGVARADVAMLYCTPDNRDGDFDDADPARAEEDVDIFRAECASSDAVAAGRDLDSTFTDKHGTQIDLRWVYVHMIEEYARHNGHADLLRECIDGVTGD